MSEQRWTLDSLKKAYQQGYLHGLAGQDLDACPYQNDVLKAAWEAGLDDGTQEHNSIRLRKLAKRA